MTPEEQEYLMQKTRDSAVNDWDRFDIYFWSDYVLQQTILRSLRRIIFDEIVGIPNHLRFWRMQGRLAWLRKEAGLRGLSEPTAEYLAEVRSRAEVFAAKRDLR